MKISEATTRAGAVFGRALADEAAQVLEAGAEVGDQRQRCRRPMRGDVERCRQSGCARVSATTTPAKQRAG